MAEELDSLTCSQLIQKLLTLFETDQDDIIDEVLDWFLFTYSPEHAFELVQANSEALKDPLLLDIIMTKVKDVYEPEIFLETLNVVACLGESVSFVYTSNQKMETKNRLHPQEP